MYKINTKLYERKKPWPTTMAAPKKSLLHEHFSKLFLDEIVKDDRKSEYACNKCVWELEKFGKAMLNAYELRKKECQNIDRTTC